MAGNSIANERDEAFDPDRTLPMQRQDQGKNSDQQVKRGSRNDPPEKQQGG
jgi:hypothetical protein